jgi:hypothetical protein
MTAETIAVDSKHVKPLVSVVVTAHNAASELPVLLEALAAQTLPRSAFEVIVVDDGSEDETSSVVEGSGLARLIRSPLNVGQPRARNIGIRAAAGRFIALTDADTVPDPTWLETGITRMRETDADIVAGGVSIALGNRPSIAALVDAMNWLNPKLCVEAGFPLGANIWARRETFDRWGLFSEEGTTFMHDDAEWGKRATRAGAKLEYAPDVHLTHPPRSRMRQVQTKAYRSGLALAPHRRPPLNTVEGLPPLFLRPTPYLPPRRISLERVHELGYSPTPSERVRMHLSQWIFVRLPMLAGDFVGELRYLRERRRVMDSTNCGA